jgi:hypothetical protein
MSARVVAELEHCLSATAARLTSAPSRFGPILSPGDPKRGQALLERVVLEMLAELRRLDITGADDEVNVAPDEANVA